MIQFKNLIGDDKLYEGRTKEISLDKARRIFNQNIASAYYPNKNHEIYRGIQNDFDVGFVEPAKFNRESAHTANFYTLMMDNLPEWSEYPRRSKSIVCSTSIGTAKDFGTLYQIFPFDGADLGVAPVNDIWNSFYFDLGDVNAHLEGIAKYTKKGPDKIPEDSFQKFKNTLLKVDEVAKEINFYKKVFEDPEFRNKKFLKFIKTYLKSDVDNLLEFLRFILHPEKGIRGPYRFKVKKYKEGFEVRGHSYPGREIWTESPCLVIRRDQDLMEKFFKDKKYYMKDIDKIDI